MRNSQQSESRNSILTSRLGEMGWYPETNSELSKLLDNHLKSIHEEKISDICAMIVPHAGYRYSGQTAAFAYSQIQNRHYSRVIIMGPSHAIHLQNSASIAPVSLYKTPLGTTELDIDFINKLKKSPFFLSNTEAHETEHSVQIQLPYLQMVLNNFKCVPIVVGQLDNTSIFEIAKVLKESIDKNTLIIVSSDFTHYGTRFGYTPFQENVVKNLTNLDMGAYTTISKKDSKTFQAYCDDTGTTICGKYPISILLEMLPKTATSHLLNYTTSGDLTNDWSNSVSYMSIAFSGIWDNKMVENKDTINVEPSAPSVSLSESDKEKLLTLARKTIAFYLINNQSPKLSDLGIDISDNMKSIMGAFVTLKKENQLRGCIGEILPRRPLYEAIIEQSINASTNDPRFPRVSLKELENITIEISALTPPSVVSKPADIILGRHGIILEKYAQSAVFLPQVAPEQGWTLEETLNHLSAKAGLTPNDWKNNTRFMVFEAIVFNESDF